MPRPPRHSQQGYCYHVLNRGNARSTLFFDDVDYTAFVKLLAGMRVAFDVRLLAYALMPNHFHLALQPGATGDLSEAMHWAQTSYAARLRVRYETTGHIFQGRFKAFPIQQDEHLLTVMRYIERNPLRANLVRSAIDWRWSSLRWRERPNHWLDPCPVDLGAEWPEYVDAPQTASELSAIRESLKRGAPFGSDGWRLDTGKKLGLESTLRPRGRPRKLTL